MTVYEADILLNTLKRIVTQEFWRTRCSIFLETIH